MYDVTKIEYSPGDIIIFSVNIDEYSFEECDAIIKNIKKQNPTLNIIIVPSYFINEIINIKKSPIDKEDITPFYKY